ncbi:MAG: hypothetical protein HUK22_03345, partial [Thermoguttaceae bacterium]|nr:hypothetical protein [Thermoguttaceae bacterium]
VGVDPNLAEGLPITDLPLKALDGKANKIDEKFEIPNGDFEKWNNDKILEVNFVDEPGKVSFRDDKIFHSGAASARFECENTGEYGHARMMRELNLKPGRLYRVSAWFRVENIDGSVLMQIYDGDDQVASVAPKKTKGSPEWTRVSTTFRAPESGKTRLYLGGWGTFAGKFWIDDIEVEPLGLINPLRRPGTPFVVTDKTGKITYEEGKDWALPNGYRPYPWRADAEEQSLRIPAGSRIKDGDTILVDFYYPPLVGAPQIGTCMSEPALYELFEESAATVAKVLKPKKWFLSMDEIRCAGTCEACRERGISLAAILADCISRQREIIKNATPDADVYIWSDMLDPNHNAHDNYYVCEGDYTGVWDLIPKDLIISCWYYEIRDKSMKFFSERGFKTQGAAYYDADDLDGCVDWVETCNHTPGCAGIMYATWQDKYELLEDFGKLVSEKLNLPR